MLKYTGHANFEELFIKIYGDGYTKDVTIDLKKPPFNLNFTGFFPKNIGISDINPGMAKTVTLNNDNLTIIFLEAPPALDFSQQTITGPVEGHLEFKVYFVYGTGVE